MHPFKMNDVQWYALYTALYFMAPARQRKTVVLGMSLADYVAG